MARCLIVGCGCRGVALGRELIGRGHVVRATTRRPERTDELEAAGLEAFIGDPDRIATLAPALERVSAVCVLLGSASGSRPALEALHGPRLEMLLTRVLDSPVRGVVYEASGDVERRILDAGAGVVRFACERSRIPYVVLRAELAPYEAWVARAADALEAVLQEG